MTDAQVTSDNIASRARDLTREHQNQIYRGTSRTFAMLMPVQWIAGIAASLWILPGTWSGAPGRVGIHVLLAIFVGGAITSLPVYLALTRPALPATRYVVAACQMLMSILLIHLTGGRMETQLHLFGSLALLAFYRDWRVLIPATLVVAANQTAGLMYFPQSVFGVLAPLCEEIVLYRFCLRSVRKMRDIAEKRASLEGISEGLEQKLQRKTEQLEKASGASSEFLAIMSNEIRRPIKSVIGLTGLLLETPISGDSRTLPDREWDSPAGGLSGRQRKYAETIRSSGESLLAIVDDILEFSRLEAGELVLESRAFDLRKVAEESLQTVAPMAHRKKLELCAALEEPLPAGLIGDPARLQQVIVNLLSNAVKFTETGEVVLSVTCETTATGEAADEERMRVRFEVRDTGIGISDEARTELLRTTRTLPGQEGDTLGAAAGEESLNGSAPRSAAFAPLGSSSLANACAKRRSGGTGPGPGLVNSKRLAELMGGEMGVRSEPGEGSLFWFEAPFRMVKTAVPALATKELAQVMAAESRLNGRVPPTFGAASGGPCATKEPAHNGHGPRGLCATGKNFPGRRVLVIDDNAASRDILKWQLGRSGMVVTCAGSGMEGIEALSMAASGDRPFELAILDFHMPVMNGLTVAKEIRRRNAISSTPIMMLTTDRGRGEATMARELDVRIVLVKPVREANLIQAVGEMLAATGRGRRGAAPVRFGRPEPRILVVEDNPESQEEMVLWLGQLGCSVAAANNGYEAVQATGGGQVFDAILMNCELPIMDGLEATAWIRVNGRTHNTDYRSDGECDGRGTEAVPRWGDGRLHDQTGRR
jgi:signal transduction histidine kinase/DNA-binding response OmpR family regulator